jgi:Arc/MetJ family transcription regulator
MATRTTTVEIDETKLGQVKRVLGTETLRETVDRSFDEVLARAARQKSIARLRKMDGLDLGKRRVMERAWR